MYVLEVNPRASRTVPYLSKATGVPLAKVAAQLMVGQHARRARASIDDLTVSGVFVKTPVFPFVRFPGVDTLLGPEMKSTGEVMGGADTFGSAFAKAQMGAGQHLPDGGHRVHQRQQPRQGERRADRARARAARLQARRDARHRRLPARARPRRRHLCTRSTKGARTSATSCSTAGSRSSSTRRSAASRSSTTARCGAWR